MKFTPIIPIQRASEKTIETLINIGILYTDENGIHVKEKSTEPDNQSDQC